MTWMGLSVVNVAVQTPAVGVIFQLPPVARAQEGSDVICSTLQTLRRISKTDSSHDRQGVVVNALRAVANRCGQGDGFPVAGVDRGNVHMAHPGVQPVVLMVTVTVMSAALMLTHGQALEAGLCVAPRVAAQRKRSAKPSKLVIIVVGAGWCWMLLVGWFEFDCTPRSLEFMALWGTGHQCGPAGCPCG